MNTLTVLPFLLAFFAGVAAMPTNIYSVCAWNVGTLEIEPWRQRSSHVCARVRTVFAWIAAVWRQRTVRLTVAAALALLVAHLHGASDASAMTSSGLAFGVVAGEVGLAEVKDAIDQSNRLFGEFKETNDKRLKQLEERGVVDPLLTQKLEKLSAAMDSQAAVNEAFIATQATVNRLALVGLSAPTNDRAEELRRFNLAARSVAKASGRDAPPALTMDDYDNYKAAQDKYLRNQFMTDAEKKTMSVGSNTDGGHTVTADISGRMVQRIFETSPMRQFANVQTISTDALEGSADLDEATFQWVGEQSPRPNTNTPQVPAPWRIPVHEASASPDTTQKNLEDSAIDVGAWLSKKSGDKIGRGFNAAFVNGNGVNKPRGWTTYPTEATADETRAWGRFEHLLTGTDSSFGNSPNGSDKLIQLVHLLKEAYVPNAAFYMHRLTLGGVRMLKDANGSYVFLPSQVVGAPDTAHGFPVRKMSDMALYTTADSLAIGFGDMFETYQIVDRLGITVLVDPYTAKPKVVFYTRARVGGDVVNFESMKFLKFGD